MKKFRRIGAIIIIILLLSLYLICFGAAISGSEKLQPLFKITLGMTVVLPVLLYAFLLFLRMAKDRQGPVLIPPEETEGAQEGEQS